MEMLISNNTNEILAEHFEALVERVALKSLEIEGVSSNVEVSVSFVSKDEIRDINKKFRKIDKETDVLSFPLYKLEQIKKLTQDNQLPLGDIVICLDVATEQAESFGHSIEREIAFLTAHSMLHLLEYDHETAEKEQIMFAKQEEVLTLLNILR